jgi:hypothetical protein
MSSSDSDLSDIPIDSLFPKRRKYEEEENSNDNFEHQKLVKEIDSDDEFDDYSDDNADCGDVRQLKSETMKKNVFQDDSEESENESKSEEKRIDSQKIIQKQQDIKILDDSDESDTDCNISSSALSVINNAFLEQARKARIELDRMPHIDLLSDNDVDDIDIYNSNHTNQEINSKPDVNHPVTKIMQEYVQVTTQVKGGDASIQKIYQLKLHDPFSKLAATYKKERGYSSFRKISFELIIQKNTESIELDLNKSPHEMGIHDQCLLLVHDEEQRIKQLRNNPNCVIVGDVRASSDGKDSTGTLPTCGKNNYFGNGILTLKVRINGNVQSIQNYKMNPTESFQKLVQLVCNNIGGIDSRECKFIFEGLALNPNGTPEDEDLEGDEMIDVSIDEATLARIEQKKHEQLSSLESNRNFVSTKDLGQNNQKTISRQIVEVLIVRNDVSGLCMAFIYI